MNWKCALHLVTRIQDEHSISLIISRISFVYIFKWQKHLRESNTNSTMWAINIMRFYRVSLATTQLACKPFIHCNFSQFHHVFTRLHRWMGIASSTVTDVRRFPAEKWSNHNGTGLLDWIDRLHWGTVRNVFVWCVHKFHGLQAGNGISGDTHCDVLVGNYIRKFGESHNISQIFGRLDGRWYSIVDYIIRGWDIRWQVKCWTDYD